MPCARQPPPRPPALFAIFAPAALSLLLIFLAVIHPAQLSQQPSPEDLQPLHAALALSGDVREAELQNVMPRLKRGGCPLVHEAVLLTHPPSHTVHMHAAFCSSSADAAAHFSHALALQPSNAESVLAAAYHASMRSHSQRLILGILARLVPPPLRTGRQLYALAIAAAAQGRFRSSSHYFSLAVGRGLPVRDAGDSWAMALVDGGQPLRALQVLLQAGCCEPAGPQPAAEGCHATAINVAESLIAHSMPSLALLLLQCGSADGRLPVDVMHLSCSARAHRSLGNISAAAALFEQALQLQPSSADAQRNMGMILQEAGLLQQAEQHLRFCLHADPRDATALTALATVNAKTGRVQQAEELFLAAAQLQPDNDTVRSNVATFYRNNKMWSKAKAFAEQALARDPSACDMLAQLVQIYGQQSQPQPALAASARYAACCSSGGGGRAACADAKSALLSDVFFRRQLCDWSSWHDDVELLQLAASSEGFRASSFSAIQASVFPVAPDVIRAFARRQAAEFERIRHLVMPPPAAAAAAAAVPHGPHDALRIGFSFSDWFGHPVGDDALAAVSAAAADGVRYRSSVFCISPSLPLRMQALNRSHPCLLPPVETFFLGDNSTEAAASALHSANLHVLLDFNGRLLPSPALFAREAKFAAADAASAGWTAGHRMELLAASSVPVIVNVKGYPLSTEASWVNYHLADAVVLPAELWSNVHSEAALLMPCSYHLNGHSVHKGQPPRRINGLMVEGGVDGGGYSFPRGQVVACAFHRPVKLDPASLSMWARIILAHPSAVLWMVSYEDYALQNLRRELDSRSLSGRYIIAAMLPHDEQFIAKSRCDLFLDALIYGAHGTAADALWSSVPVLTVPSAQPQGRVAASLLRQHVTRSAPDPDDAACQCLAAACTVARSVEDAVQLGMRLLARPELLRGMRRCLHEAAASGAGVFDYAYWTAKALAGSRMAGDAVAVDGRSFHVIVAA